MTRTVAATDNVTLSTDAPVEPEQLLALADEANALLERNREALLQHIMELSAYGTSTALIGAVAKDRDN